MSDDPTHEAPNNPVPWQRFVKVNEKASALEARVAELEAEAQSWQQKAATADTLAQQVQQWQTTAEQAQVGLTEYQAAARLGVTDPELFEAAKWAHSRLPEAERPAFGEALESWKGDPSTAPLVLRPHLAPPAAPPQAAPPAGAPQAPLAPAAAPPPNNGAAPYQGAPQALDVMDMDIATYRQHRDKYKSTSLL